jgi:hypothetical protein
MLQKKYTGQLHIMRRTQDPTQMLGNHWPSFRHIKILMCYYNLQIHRIYTAPYQNNRARRKRVFFSNLPEITINIDIGSFTLHPNSILRIQTEVLYALQYDPLMRIPYRISTAYQRILLKLAKNVSTFLSFILTKTLHILIQSTKVLVLFLIILLFTIIL